MNTFTHVIAKNTETLYGVLVSLEWKGHQVTRGFLHRIDHRRYGMIPLDLNGCYMEIEADRLSQDVIDAVERATPLPIPKTVEQIAREAHHVVLALAEGDHDAEDPSVMRAVRYFADDWRTGASILPFELGADAADRALDEFTKTLADLAHFEQSYRGVRTLPADYVQRKVALEEAVKAKRVALRTMLGAEQ